MCIKFFHRLPNHLPPMCHFTLPKGLRMDISYIHIKSSLRSSIAMLLVNLHSSPQILGSFLNGSNNLVKSGPSALQMSSSEGFTPRYVLEMDVVKLPTPRNTSKPNFKAAGRTVRGTQVEFTSAVSISESKT